jgi:Kef-type K+ transport system membrane component KefB
MKHSTLTRGRFLLLLVGLLGSGFAVELTDLLQVSLSAETWTTVVSLGLLLLGGSLLAGVAEWIKLPHLSAYLVAGILAGPHLLNWVDTASVHQLEPVNTLALALIALGGGVELRISALRANLRSLVWATIAQSSIVLIAASAVFLALQSQLAFLREMTSVQIAAVAVLWGILAVSRSPSACLAILTQTRANGPLAAFSLAFIMLSDVVVLLLLTVALAFAKAAFDPQVDFAWSSLQTLGHELLGSVAFGTTLGLGLVIYLRFFGHQLLLVILVVGFGFTDVLRYVRFEPLLAFLTAGFFIQNFSRQGEKLQRAVHEAGSLVFVAFFATAGAHLDLPLLYGMWPVACALCAGRLAATWFAGRVAARRAGDPEVLQRFGWAGMVSQAGLTLGLSLLIERAFPSFGGSMRSLVIVTVAINEIVGPIIFKVALDRAGESRDAAIAANAV